MKFTIAQRAERRFEKKLSQHGIAPAEPHTRFEVKTEAEYIASWVDLYGKPPSAHALKLAREEGKVK